MINLLATLGYILLGVLCFLVWIIIIPRTIYIEYTKKENWTIRIQIFIFKIKLYPWQFTKKDKNAVESTEEAVNEAIEKEINDKKLLPNEGAPVDDTNIEQKDKVNKKSSKAADTFNMEIIKQAFKALNGVKKIILRFLKIKDISFTLPINGENAIETQKKYAAATTTFYAINTFLQRYVKIYYKSPVFVADFANLYRESVYFYCKIQASPSIILVIGYYLYKNYKSTFIKYIMKEK